MLRLSYGSLIVVGLDTNNIRRLLKGEPIYFRGDRVGTPNHEFLILAGETNIDMANELRGIGIPIPLDWAGQD